MLWGLLGGFLVYWGCVSSFRVVVKGGVGCVASVLGGLLSLLGRCCSLCCGWRSFVGAGVVGCFVLGWWCIPFFGFVTVLIIVKHRVPLLAFRAGGGFLCPGGRWC